MKLNIELTNKLELNTPIIGKIIKIGSKTIEQNIDKNTTKKVECFGCDIEFMGGADKPVNVSFIADPKIDAGSSYTSSKNSLTKFTQFCLNTSIVTVEDLINKKGVEKNILNSLPNLIGKKVECSILKSDKGYYQIDLDSLKISESK